MPQASLARVAAGRTDLVFDLLAAGTPANARSDNSVLLLQWCAYYGDVSALRHLLLHGEHLSSLGDNFDLNGAAFHGHWALCQFLIESGADVGHGLPHTGETPLHAAVSGAQLAQTHVVRVLLANGADPNRVTHSNVETGAFMRDCRTRGETPLHRAAAFASSETIQLLLDSGADLQARDKNGDSALGWASWYRRPADILRLLCFGDFRIHADYLSMQSHLLGNPDA